MKNETNWQKLGLALVLLAFLIWGGSYVIKQGKTKQAVQQTQETQIISYQGVEGKNALELLQKEHQVNFQTSDFGVFVTEIDGIKNTEDTFWMYYVNEKLAEVAADKYATKEGDKIEWKYEKVQW